jgi:hypothetical protein
MRPLLVKRQTAPESGFFSFFPPCEFQRDRPSVSCLTCLPYSGANLMWLHQTRIEVPSPCTWRLQSTVGVILCDLEMMSYPHTVLLKRLAERMSLASEYRARGRGSTRNQRRLSPSFKEPERVSNQSEGLRAKRPRV